MPSLAAAPCAAVIPGTTSIAMFAAVHRRFFAARPKIQRVARL